MDFRPLTLYFEPRTLNSSIRSATADDAPGIARVHVDTWRTAYRGIVPDGFLDNLSYQGRESRWHDILSGSETDNSFVYVAANEAGEIVGFASGGPAEEKEEQFQGELRAIYVLEETQGQGIGKRLVQAVAQRLASMGMTSMLLYVFKDNHQARRFYESLGGVKVYEQRFDLAGVTMEAVGYGWPDITALIGESEK